MSKGLSVMNARIEKSRGRKRNWDMRAYGDTGGGGGAERGLFCYFWV